MAGLDEDLKAALIQATAEGNIIVMLDLKYVHSNVIVLII